MKSHPYIWPDGNRCCVLIAVLFDDGYDALAKAPDLANRPKSYSVWEYGAKRGVDRLLLTLENFDVGASWFVPGIVMEKHPDIMHRIVEQGHEIAARGFNFEHYARMERQAILTSLQRDCQLIEAICQKSARGLSLPAGQWPNGFDALMQQAGFDWSASLNGDDIPYYHQSGIVEIPVHRELEDRPYFQFNFSPPFPKGLSRLPAYQSVLGNWRAEFDAYRHYGLCFVLQIRPEMIATPGRIFILQELLRHICSFDDVWLANGSMIADWHRSHGRGNEDNHPLEVFSAYRWENGRHDNHAK